MTLSTNSDPTRATVAGKFLQLGPERFWVKGVSYGTFAPDTNGQDFVHEQVTWFEHKGATTIVRALTVRPGTQSVDCGDSGSPSCPAAR